MGRKMNKDVSKFSAKAVTDGETILATADLAAPPDRVFTALNTDEVETWWGSPDTYRMTAWKADLRVGGRWSAVVVMADGARCPASGVFLEIDAPSKIVLTRRYDWDYPLLGWRDTTVTYRLDPLATGTRMTVRHDGFASTGAAAAQHAEGWERFLGFLQTYLNGPGAS
jgi:uncharacterized protein YndB with AHSA1/START domain